MLRVFSFLSLSILFLACNTTEMEKTACERAPELTEICVEEAVDCVQSLPQNCTYGDVLVETDECACRDIVYQAICDAGITDSVETIENGLVCEIVEE